MSVNLSIPSNDPDTPTLGVPLSATGTRYYYASFTDNGDGTITDNITGLAWSQDADHGKMPLIMWTD